MLDSYICPLPDVPDSFHLARAAATCLFRAQLNCVLFKDLLLLLRVPPETERGNLQAGEYLESMQPA